MTNKSLDFYNIEHDSIILLYIRDTDEIYIYIKILSNIVYSFIQMIRLKVKLIDTIESIKCKLIEKEDTLKESMQNFYFNSLIMDNNKPLYDYDITDGSILYLFLKENNNYMPYIIIHIEYNKIEILSFTISKLKSLLRENKEIEIEKLYKYE